MAKTHKDNLTHWEINISSKFDQYINSTAKTYNKWLKKTMNKK